MGLHNSRLLAFLLALAVFGLAAMMSLGVHAATVTIVNNNASGVGFNDPTVVAPVGGNAGATLGAQRLVAFQFAADIWGGLLASAVPIRVGAQFNPLTCSATSAILGSAGPTTVFRDYTGAPVPTTYYPVGLANALHGTDLNVGVDDISATFNSAIGTTCALPRFWYYGLDGNPPGSQIDFVSVLLHELGHGLGFLTFVDLATGARLNGFNDVFMRNLEDHGATPSDYPSMTNAQRVSASTHTGSLHWVGAKVRASSGLLSAGKLGDHVQMYAPSPQQSGSSVSHWDTALTPNQILEPTYTVPLHRPALELPLFQDIGWSFLYPLTVAKLGTGTGAVTSSPAGISCGATCSASYPSGTSVTLSAAAAAGSGFTGWSGACSGGGSCVVSMSVAQSVTVTFALGASSSLINLSTRGQVQTGNNVMIGGFIIGGSSPKKVLIRAVGPNLANYGVSGVLADPMLELHRSSDGAVIASNDDWGTSVNAAEIQATTLAPVNSKESAILITLDPGAYTAIVTGKNAGTGVGIVEVYEIDHPEIPLINISTRGRVEIGDSVMIGGFIIQGSTNQTVLIRAVGPNLLNYGVTGVLANPKLDLYSGQTNIANNDNWQTATNAAAIQATGLAPVSPLESAILISLPPGAYTAIVSGSDGGSGVGIVEVFAQ